LANVTIGSYGLGCGAATNCPGGGCVPNGVTACVYQAGQNLHCPAGYGVATTVFDNPGDATCSCTCNAPTNVTCTGTVIYYTDCTPPLSQVDTAGLGVACTYIGPFGGVAVTASLSSGSCPSSASQNPGTPSGVYTVCCP
jgi:hypothetical protein